MKMGIPVVHYRNYLLNGSLQNPGFPLQLFFAPDFFGFSP